MQEVQETAADDAADAELDNKAIRVLVAVASLPEDMADVKRSINMLEKKLKISSYTIKDRLYRLQNEGYVCSSRAGAFLAWRATYKGQQYVEKVLG